MVYVKNVSVEICRTENERGAYRYHDNFCNVIKCCTFNISVNANFKWSENLVLRQKKYGQKMDMYHCNLHFHVSFDRIMLLLSQNFTSIDFGTTY